MRAAAFMLALLPGAAPAQVLHIPSVDADPAVLLGCLASGKGASTCLGAMTLDCQAENDIGNDNLEERLCVDEELNTWRDLLGRAQARLRARLQQLPAEQRPALSGDPVAALEKAGTLWAKWRDSQCRLERLAAGAGDRRAIIGDICLRDLTAARYGRLTGIETP